MFPAMKDANLILWMTTKPTLTRMINTVSSDTSQGD